MFKKECPTGMFSYRSHVSDIWQSLALNTSALFGSDAWLEPLGYHRGMTLILINAKLLWCKINQPLNLQIFSCW